MKAWMKRLGRHARTVFYMRLRVRTLLMGAVVLALAGGSAVLLGLIPIRASSGHWPVTEAFLKFAMRRGVAMQSRASELPTMKLSDERLVLKGAGHYENGCRYCHGSPSLRHPPVTDFATPRPPYLDQQDHDWEPRELFFIVQHGIKFTGMPGWPSQQRPDEVWAMVAFLERFPKLDSEQYQALVDEPASDDAFVTIERDEHAATHGLALAQCARCHGRTGNGRGLGAFPKLAGQSAVYLEAALAEYASGVRPSGIMEPHAAALNASQRRLLAEFYAAMERMRHPAESYDRDDASAERGRAIAMQGNRNRKIGACVDCHGPGKDAKRARYPELNGQYRAYLIEQLHLFRADQRGNSPDAQIMTEVASRMTDQQIADVARYFSELPGE